MVTAEPVVAVLLAINEAFNNNRVNLAGMANDYNKYMSCVREYYILIQYYPI